MDDPHKASCPHCKGGLHTFQYTGDGGVVFNCSCGYQWTRAISRPIDDTLSKRGQTHGPYDLMSCMTQCIKEAIRAPHQWRKIPPYMQESLDMIALKMARIVCGDHTCIDSWHDIQGYAKLVEDRILTAEKPACSNVGGVTGGAAINAQSRIPEKYSDR